MMKFLLIAICIAFIPFRVEAVEGRFTIRTRSLSYIEADRVWICGESVCYERRGLQGQLRLTDVDDIMDREYELQRSYGIGKEDTQRKIFEAYTRDFLLAKEEIRRRQAEERERSRRYWQ